MVVALKLVLVWEYIIYKSVNEGSSQYHQYWKISYSSEYHPDADVSYLEVNWEGSNDAYSSVRRAS